MELIKKAEKYDELLFINKEKALNCSFCGKRQEDVRKLVASPRAIICDECISLCNEVLEDEVKEREEVK